MFQLSEIDVLLLRTRLISFLFPIQLRSLFQHCITKVGWYYFIPFPKKVRPGPQCAFNAQWQHLNINIEGRVFVWKVRLSGFQGKNRLFVRIAQRVLLTTQLHQLMSHFQVLVLVPMTSSFFQSGLFFGGKFV